MKLLASLMLMMNFYTYAQAESGQAGTGKQNDEIIVNLISGKMLVLKCEDFNCEEVSHEIKGGVTCKYCPAETSKCAPRSDCIKKLYE